MPEDNKFAGLEIKPKAKAEVEETKPAAITAPDQVTKAKLQEKAIATINAVEEEAMEKLGQPGCNPYLYRKNVLKPLRDGVTLMKDKAIAEAIQLVCPAFPNGDVRGPEVKG